MRHPRCIRTLLQAIATALSASTAASAAPTYQWNSAADSTWLNAGNWLPTSQFPGTAGLNSSVDLARFSDVDAASSFVSIDASPLTDSALSLGGIDFSLNAGTGLFSIGGGGDGHDGPTERDRDRYDRHKHVIQQQRSNCGDGCGNT